MKHMRRLICMALMIATVQNMLDMGVIVPGPLGLPRTGGAA